MIFAIASAVPFPVFVVVVLAVALIVWADR